MYCLGATNKVTKGKKQKKLIAGKDFIVHPCSNSYNAKAKVYYLDTLHLKSKSELTKILSNLPKKSVLICKSGVTNNKTFYVGTIKFLDYNSLIDTILDQ